MKKIFLSVIAIVVALLTSCATESGNESKMVLKFWLDNPLGSEMNVKIDNTNYTLPPESGTMIELKVGKHSLEYEGEKVDFRVLPNQFDEGIINPSMSNYIAYHEIYVEDYLEKAIFDGYEEIEKRYSTPMVVDGQEILAPFYVYNDLFINRKHSFESWSYGVNYSFEDIIELNDGTSIFSLEERVNGTVITKLMRESEYFEFVKGYRLLSKIEFEHQKKGISEVEPFILIGDVAAINCDDADAHIEKVRALWNTILIAEDPEAMKEAHYELLLNGRFSNETNKKCGSRISRRPGDEIVPEKVRFDSISDHLNVQIKKLSDFGAVIVK